MSHSDYNSQEQVETQGDALVATGRPAVSPAPRMTPAVTLLVVAGASSVVGCFLAIPAAIFGILAVVNQADSPSRSAKFTRWGWIAYATGASLWVLAAVALMMVAGYAASGNN